MSQPEFKTEELIIATVASMKKWENISIETLDDRCGFCDLIRQYEKDLCPDDTFCNICPAHDICEKNIDFWSEIERSPRLSFNPGKYKYQQRRIQKNIDWIKAYLKEIQT